jgi:hypothetical protein
MREVADEVGISIGSCHNIFSNVLGIKRVAAKFIPKQLNFGQKQHRSHSPTSIFIRYGSVRLFLIPKNEENLKTSQA